MSRLVPTPQRFPFIMSMAASFSRRLAVLAACIATMVLPAVAAATPDTRLVVSQYQHTAWLSKDGAPLGIHAVAQTDDGTLWLGAEDGLYRFDGQAFERVPTPGGPAAGKPYVYALVARPGNALWVGFRRGGGIGLLKDGQFTRLPSTLKHEVDFMAADSRGTLWAQMESRLYRIEDLRLETPPASWNVPARVNNFAVDHAGALWLTALDHRLFRLAPGGTRFELACDDFPVVSIAVDLQGGLWGSNQNGTWNVPMRDGQPASPRHSIEGNFFGTMMFDREGGLWLQRLSGLSREADAEMVLDDRVNREPPANLISADRGLSSETIYAMFQDRDGNVWTGTSKGLDRFRRTMLTPVRLPGRALSSAMEPAGGGAVWTGNWAGPLRKVTDRAWQAYPSVGPAVKFIRHDSKGGLWVGGGNGLWHSADGETFHDVPADEAFIADSLRAWEDDGSGGFWVSGGGSGRLAHVVDGHWTEPPPSAGFPSEGSPRCLVKDDQRRIWGCLGADPLVIVGDKASRLSSITPGLDIGTVATIRPHGSHVWMGGYLGLALVDGRRVVNIVRSDGLPFGEVGGIVELASGDLWLHNRTRAMRVPAADVKAVLAGMRTSVGVESLDELDGLYGTLSASSPLPSLVQADDGRLWFSTDAGLAWLDPDRAEQAIPPPPLRIGALIADGRRYGAGSPVLLEPRNKRVELSYSATALTTPERVRFRYRLDGIDSDWQEVGSRRTAYFNDLPPGNYAFRVKSTDERGRWVDNEARVEFRVAPAWFQTAWFRAAAAVLVVLAAWLLHRWRARHLLSLAESRLVLQMQARTAERDRIARDLHDTVLQGTTGLVLNLQVEIDRLSMSADDRRRVQALLEQADRTVDEARTRVTGLRTGPERPGSFADGLRRIGQQAVGGSAIHFEMAPDSFDWTFDPQVEDQLALIVREALGNACQHARAGRLVVRLVEEGGHRVIRVIDDGIGFAVAETASAAKASGHWGLYGMKERAAEIGAQFDIRSHRGGGTEVAIAVPIARPRFGRRRRAAPERSL